MPRQAARKDRSDDGNTAPGWTKETDRRRTEEWCNCHEMLLYFDWTCVVGGANDCWGTRDSWLNNPNLNVRDWQVSLVWIWSFLTVTYQPWSFTDLPKVPTAPCWNLPELTNTRGSASFTSSWARKKATTTLKLELYIIIIQFSSKQSEWSPFNQNGSADTVGWSTAYLFCFPCGVDGPTNRAMEIHPTLLGWDESME